MCEKCISENISSQVEILVKDNVRNKTNIVVKKIKYTYIIQYALLHCKPLQYLTYTTMVHNTYTIIKNTHSEYEESLITVVILYKNKNAISHSNLLDLKNMWKHNNTCWKSFLVQSKVALQCRNRKDLVI